MQKARDELQAAIDDAKARLESLNRKTNERVDSLADVTQSQEAYLAAIYQEMLDSILVLHEADARLKQGIIAAHAYADQAYKLAQQDSVRIDSLAKALYETQQDLGNTKLTIEETRKRVEATEGGLASLTDDFLYTTQALQDDIKDLKTRMEKAEADITYQLSQIEAHDAQLKSLQATNQDILDSLDAMVVTDQRMEAAIQGNRIYIENNKQDIMELQEDVLIIRDSLEQAKAEMRAYTDQQVTAVRILLQGVAEEQAAQLQAHNTQLEEHDNQLNTHSQLLAQHKELLDEVFGDVDALKELLDQRYNQVMEILATLASKGELETAKSELQGEIQASSDRLDVRIDSLGTVVEAQTMMLNTVDAAYKAADEHLQEQIDDLNKRFAALEGRVDSINTLVDSIYYTRLEQLYDILYSNTQELITSIVYQDKNVKNVYARVVGSGDSIVFPYSGYDKAQKLAVGILNFQREAGYIYATINPYDNEYSKHTYLSLVNSLGEESKVYELEYPTTANIRLTRAANGLWVYPVLCIAPDTMDVDNMLYDTEMRYALRASYVQERYDKNNEDKYVQSWDARYVYSQYAIVMEPEPAGTATTLTIEGLNENSEANPAAGVDLRFRTDSTAEGKVLPMRMKLGTDGVRVYRKFIECIGVYNSNGTEVSSSKNVFNRTKPTINGATEGRYYYYYHGYNARNEPYEEVTWRTVKYDSLRSIFETPWGQDADVIAFEYPDDLKNLYVKLRYYVWNYDGTITTRDFVVIYDDSNTIPAFQGA